MPAGMPLVVGQRMAPTANGAGQFNAWSHSRIIRVGGMIARDAVTIFALNTLQQRVRGRARTETSRVAVANGVTRKALGVGALVGFYKRRERLWMQSMVYVTIGILVAFGAVLSSHIVRGGSFNLEDGIALGGSQRGSPDQVRRAPDGLPLRFA